MKKRLFAILMIALMLLSCGCHKATLEDYKLFRSTPLGFSIEYPDFWKKASSNKEGAAVFITPSEGLADTYYDSLSVQRFRLDIEGENAYNEYVKGYVADLEATLKNYKLVSETDITLDGEEAYQIVYESANDDGSEERRFMQIFAEHDDYVYVVSFVAEFESYSYFLTYVEQMISTFKWL